MTVTDLVSPATSPTQKKSSLPDDPSGGETFKFQDKLPKLPIPELEITAEKYLAALEPLQVRYISQLTRLFSNAIYQTLEEHVETKLAVQEFLIKDGPELQAKLQTYATDKSSYIEEFW